jgi:hypothetical protein
MVMSLAGLGPENVCLFNDALSSSEYTASNYWMVVNYEELGRKWLWPNLRYYPSSFVEGLRIVSVPVEMRTRHLSNSSLVPPLERRVRPAQRQL